MAVLRRYTRQHAQGPRWHDYLGASHQDLGQYAGAIGFCAQGVAIRPATAELAWLAGFAAYRARRYEDAIA